MAKVVIYKNGHSKRSKASVIAVIEANKKVFDKLAKR